MTRSMNLRRLALAVIICLMNTISISESSTKSAQAQEPLIIAHRGACGYLPEHTLAAKSLAHAMRADYLEQDFVLSKDDIPIVLHDIHLDTVTDVATVFPDRKRADGRYYAIDFLLSEIQQLRVHERIDLESGKRVFPDRFPLKKSTFRIPTLAEEIELIQGLNQSTGREVGIYPEIKKPAWHREQGKEISPLVIKVLEQYGYKTKSDLVFLQCFDPVELRRVRVELKSNLKLVQLIGKNSWKEADTDFTEMVKPAGLDKIAEYADGIGPHMPYIVSDESGKVVTTDLVANAHQRKLIVHPFTFRADSLPKYSQSFRQLIQVFQRANVDGLFTDFPDKARASFARRR